MIDYIIRSGLCLTLLLAVYHMIFEAKKLHKFNRYFLLFCLAAGLSIPLITIEVSSNALPFTPPLSSTGFPDKFPDILQSNDSTAAIVSPRTFNVGLLILTIYGSVTLIFILRFAWNLVRIGMRITKYPKIPVSNATIVLLPRDTLPHSFLSYIFVNEKEYLGQNVEEQLIIHELTHVQEKHSLDILLVEVLRAVFWFNPIFLLYKRAIQLNHEFLADQAVVRSYDIVNYQILLLGKSVFNHTSQLTSNLNYSLTKKRLQMMTKTTSRKTAWAIKATVVPLALIIFVLFSNMTDSFKTVPALVKRHDVQDKSIVRQQPVPQKTNTKKPPQVVMPGFPASASPATQQVLDEYRNLVKKYETIDKNNRVMYSLREVSAVDKSRMQFLYGQMSTQQKHEQRIGFSVHDRKRLIQVTPSSAHFESWKDASIYGIWLDGKYIRNTELNKYKPSDIIYYFKSTLNYTDKMKQNVMQRFNLKVMYKYQLDLMTKVYFQETNSKLAATAGESTMWFAHATADGKPLQPLE